MLTIIVIGANGQLGTDLIKVTGELKNANDVGDNEKVIHSTFTKFHVVPLTHKDIEICDHAMTRKVLTSLDPDVVINTAAYHRVDECEDNVEKSYQVNAVAVRNLALVCRDLDAMLVHMSTDYVFGGDGNRCTPYTENDLPWPVNVHGGSKLTGEYFVRSICSKHMIVRTSGLYGTAGSSGKGGNFVGLMLRLARDGKAIRAVNDQRLAPTYTSDLAAKIINMVLGNNCGLYHIVNASNCSWFEFAATIFELAGLSPQLTSTTTEDFGAKANRPKYSVLASQKLSGIETVRLRPWPEALAAYLNARTQFLGNEGKPKL